MSAQSSVLFYAQIQCVYDRFKNTPRGLAVTAPSLAIASSKVISFEIIALYKASRKVTAVCRTPYSVSWQWFNKMWADPDSRTNCYCRWSHCALHFAFSFLEFFASLEPDRNARSHPCMLGCWSLKPLCWRRGPWGKNGVWRRVSSAQGATWPNGFCFESF